MKTLTLHIEEPVYRLFKETAAETGTSAAELIRDAMRRYAEEDLQRGSSLKDLEPVTLGPRYNRLDLSALGEEMISDRS